MTSPDKYNPSLDRTDYASKPKVEIEGKKSEWQDRAKTFNTKYFEDHQADISAIKTSAETFIAQATLDADDKTLLNYIRNLSSEKPVDILIMQTMLRDIYDKSIAIDGRIGDQTLAVIKIAIENIKSKTPGYEKGLDDKPVSENDDFSDLLKYREENREKILEQYGLNEYLVQSLQIQGITVEIVGTKDESYPHIDTSKVYHGVLDKDGNIRSGTMSSIPLIGYKIDSISRSSDGITVFHLTHVSSGKKISDTFSKQKFEEISYADQLGLGKPERANAKRRDRIAEQIANPTHGRDQYGMNHDLARSLQDQGITVEYLGTGEEKYPHIDTSKVHLAFVDNNGNIISGMMSSILVDGQYIDSIIRTSDGFTTFNAVDVKSGKLQKYIFSKDEWEDVPDEAKKFYKKQLEE